jgi:hypothetical protein
MTAKGLQASLRPDRPQDLGEDGWLFEAGHQRFSVPWSFMVGPAGEFGIFGARWVPLHASVEGWVESAALAYHASRFARPQHLRAYIYSGLDDWGLRGGQ